MAHCPSFPPCFKLLLLLIAITWPCLACLLEQTTFFSSWLFLELFCVDTWSVDPKQVPSEMHRGSFQFPIIVAQQTKPSAVYANQQYFTETKHDMTNSQPVTNRLMSSQVPTGIFDQGWYLNKGTYYQAE